MVGHSLGSVVAYRLLALGGPITHPVKALITLGSPLGITAVREALEPIGHPPFVDTWFNAYDERDAVALHPLDAERFPVSPPITNYNKVSNESHNHHGIQGYLADSVVITQIAEAVNS